MRNLLIIFGVIALIAGVALPLVTSFSSFGSDSFSNLLDTAADPDAVAAEFCEEGEELEVDQGPSQYNPNTGVTGRSTAYYCVEDGVRRDVTGLFVQETVGQAFEGVGSFLPGLIGTSLLSCLLVPLGVVLIIAGIVVGIRQRQSQMSTATGIQGFGTTVRPGGVYINGQPVSGSSADLQQLLAKAKRSTSAAGSADLTAKLQQLEEARAKNLISADEYERMRKQILDDMA
ncbi:MAG: hypothetical protein SF123_21830 [Chloroflexota bacterium]|nr:hypothetical protein [Chloroflexota bacterium]